MTIPTRIDSGDYFIVTIVDPNSETNDSNRTNNLGFSRKRITIQ